jgi:hypothetical protein
VLFLTISAGLAAVPPASAESSPCETQAALESSLCRADRPLVEIRATPAAPRIGAPVALRAAATGRGNTFAWDLDGDGAFDDATGAEATATFAGAQLVGVRVADGP